MSELAGRHAVVTGGGKGIGAAIASALAEDGAHLTLMGRTRETLERTAASLPKARAVVVDVANEDQVVAAFAQAVDELGPVDILVNNAGAAESAPLHRTSSELWRRMLAVNLDSAYLCTRCVLPSMRERKSGRIVNVASTAAIKGYLYSSAYCAAKHGLLGFTRALALEVAREGITVNAVCPGFAETDLLAESLQRITAHTGRSEVEARAQLLRHNPQGRFIQPEEVAACVRWLCSDAAQSITGQSLAIAGGEIM